MANSLDCLGTKPCALGLMYMSMSPQDTPWKKTVLCLVYRWGNQGSERCGHLSKDSQPECVELGFKPRTPISCLVLGSLKLSPVLMSWVLFGTISSRLQPLFISLAIISLSRLPGSCMDDYIGFCLVSLLSLFPHHDPFS